MTYYPAFTRYSPPVVDALSRIARAIAAIERVRLLPAVEEEIRRVARVGTIHYSTAIEGNPLGEAEAERAAAGTLTPTTRARIELINYVAAQDYLDECLDAGRIRYEPALVKAVHGSLMRGLGEPETSFEPRHEGAWRNGAAVVADDLGNVFHRAPPADDVDALMIERLAWCEENRSDPIAYPPAVLAAVAHYAITDVHPFADGNGRIARLVTVAILAREGLLPRRFFSFERQYATDKNGYFEALRSVRARTGNMDVWLQYFCDGLAREYERVAQRVDELNQWTARMGADQVTLTRSQEAILSRLVLEPQRQITRAEAQSFAGVGVSQAKSELAAMARIGVIRRLGSGPATRYGLAPPKAWETRGRKRTWTDERILRELLDFCAGRAAWPAYQEFVDAGRGDLYNAAARYGGIRRWRRRAGYG